MSKFVKKATKGTADVTAGALKKAFSSILGDLAKEILEETGVANLAKEKIMETGFKVVRDMGVDPKNIQRDLIKRAIISELKL